MPRHSKPAREHAARALCRHKGLPETVMLDGRPLWMTFLPEADAMLEAIGWTYQVGNPQEEADDQETDDPKRA